MPDTPRRDQISRGSHVLIQTKADQGTDNLTAGVVAEILTSSQAHPYGIKVRLHDGQVGRVKRITEDVAPHKRRAKAAKFEDLDNKTIPKTEDKDNEFKEFYQYDASIKRLAQSNAKAKIENVKSSVLIRFARAICAFGNSQDGGFVYLGVRSDGTISGLAKDKKLGGFSDYTDSFANHMRDKLESLLSDRVFLTAKVRIKFREVEGKTICLIQVLPADKPLYLKTRKEKEFLVRGSTPRSEKLDEEEQFRYIRGRFPNYR